MSTAFNPPIVQEQAQRYLSRFGTLDIPLRFKQSHILGLDLGQENDFSALTLIRVIYDNDEHQPYPTVLIEGLKKFNNANYIDQMDYVIKLRESVTKKIGYKPWLVVDRTGVGAGPCDHLEKKGVAFRPVWMTSGSKVTRKKGSYYVPKADLITRLQGFLLAGAIGIPDTPDGKDLKSELAGYQFAVKPSGHVTYGNDVGEGPAIVKNDDRVISLALALFFYEELAPTKPIL